MENTATPPLPASEAVLSQKRVSLNVTRLAGFVTVTGEPKRFKKEVLRVGMWIHPVTGELLDFSRDFLSKLVLATKRWIELGNKVWFPAGHSSDPRDNLGFWSEFALEGDRVLGVLEVPDEDAASKIGKTIQDVSAAIWWDARASTGEVFEAVLEHVCGTPCPVIPGQSNFVRLAREARVEEKNVAEKSAKGEENRKTELAADEGIDTVAAIKVLLGIPQDADDEAVISSVRALLFDEDEEDDEEGDEQDKGAGDENDKTDLDEEEGDDQDGESREIAVGAPADAAGLATLSREVETLKEENKRIRAHAAREKIERATQRSVELGVPLEDDVRKEALALLSRGDEDGERLGNRLLELALRPGAPASTSLPSPAKLEDEKTELARHAALERAYLSQGLLVEKDEKGRIKRVSRPEPKKK